MAIAKQLTEVLHQSFGVTDVREVGQAPFLFWRPECLRCLHWIAGDTLGDPHNLVLWQWWDATSLIGHE
jgi:hypothetical protein